MKEPVVTDSTCLIGLERIGHLDILPPLLEPILVPPEVFREFGTSISWLTVEALTDQALLAALKILVDDGEAEAIAVAQERGCRIILDDRHRFLLQSFLLFLYLKPISTLLILPLKGQNFGGIPD